MSASATECTVYYLTENIDVHSILEELEKVYGVQSLAEEVSEQRYLDTFDWRLFRKGCVLTRRGLRFSLETEAGQVICREKGTRKQRPCWWDFPIGPLQDALKPLIDIRALLPQFTVKRICRRYLLLNKDEKTVLRLSAISGRIDGDYGNTSFPPTLRVESLRGYKKPYRKVCGMLQQAGLVGQGKGLSVVGRAHEVLAIDPEEAGSRFSVSLQHDETVCRAVQDICLVLEAAMLLNLPGVLSDFDSEFLHDFRISVRRTRSLLSLMKKHLPLQDLSSFLAEFKWLGSVTGNVRDLDVYLLKMDEYWSMLPATLQPGLVYFFRGLERQRNKELRRLQRELTSERFTRLLEDWELFLQRLPQRDDYPKGQKGCRRVAEKTIRKRFKKILREGSQIHPGSPDNLLHRLRIEAKKFRYLLEFFRSFFSGKHVDDYLKQLKKLQNNLGDFNDLSVQQEMLVRYQAELACNDEHSVEVAAALGGLVVHMAEEQRRVRKKFEKTFQRFASQENIDLLEAVLSHSASTSNTGG